MDLQHSAHLYVAKKDRPEIRTYTQYRKGPAIPPVECSESGNSRLHEVIYWRAREGNFPSIDALICCGDEVWLLQDTISRNHRSADEGVLEVRRLMDCKTGVGWYLVILGSKLADAENARSELASCQSSVTVYAGELPLQWDERLFEEVEK